MKKFVLSLVIAFSAVNFPQDVIDKIVAIVDDEIILKSEWDFQSALFAAQRNLSDKDEAVRMQVLNALIEEKLVYAQAELDSIIVSEEDVNRQIDYQLDMLLRQYGTKEKIEQMYGMSLEKIKRELREDVKKNIMVQRLQEKKFGVVEASRREVELFFEKFKDSLGVIPEKLKLYHIFKNPATSSELKKKYRDYAVAILDSIKSGADFATMAKLYSEDPGSAKVGGDLGFVKKGIFYPEFEAAAFALNEGQISEVIESPVGFHIIQLLERRGEAIHTRHILIKVKADDEADLRMIEFLTDVRDSISKKVASFSDFARKYSDDKETAPFGGLLGIFYLNQLDKNLLDITAKLKEGDVSFPKRVDTEKNEYGYHIVYLEKRIPQHQPDIDIDYSDLKRLADDYKKQKLYKEWIDELKTKIFWELKI